MRMKKQGEVITDHQVEIKRGVVHHHLSIMKKNCIIWEMEDPQCSPLKTTCGWKAVIRLPHLHK
jgi:hypothetical protein